MQATGASLTPCGVFFVTPDVVPGERNRRNGSRVIYVGVACPTGAVSSPPWTDGFRALNGESLHVAGRLLGHRRASTTNRYVHLDDATLSQAAERVAMALQLKLHGAAQA